MIIWIWIPRLPDHAVLEEKTAPGGKPSKSSIVLDLDTSTNGNY